MSARAIRTASLLGAAVLACVAVLTTAYLNAGAKEPWSNWRTLRMTAHSVPLLSGNIEMQLRDEAEKTTFETQTTARFLGIRVANSWTTTVIDRESGRTESYVMASPKRGRRYTFGETGYTVEKLRPFEGHDVPFEEWDVRSTETFPYPLDEDGNVIAVFDYYGMLLQLGRSALDEPGDEVTLHVATTRGPMPFRVRVGEAENTTWTYKDLVAQKERTVNLRKLRLRIIPADPERADEGFMTMEGETELWVESDTKTLLSLSGKIEKVPGRVELVLAALG